MAEPYKIAATGDTPWVTVPSNDYGFIISNTSILISPMVQNHEAIAAFQFPVEARVHGLSPHLHLRARRQPTRQSAIG